MLHTTRSGERVFIELWDIGGFARFADSRSIFYHSADGLLLIHDVTNRNSYVNLKRHMREVTKTLDPKTTTTRWTGESRAAEDGNDDDLNVLQLALTSSMAAGGLPVLIFGNKKDEISAASLFRSSASALAAASAAASSDEESGAGSTGGNECIISAHNDGTFLPGSPTRATLDAFFERVCAHSAQRTPRTSMAGMLSTPALSTTPATSPSVFTPSSVSTSAKKSVLASSAEMRIDDFGDKFD
jgi:hypothetical protein